MLRIYRSKSEHKKRTGNDDSLVSALPQHRRRWHVSDKEKDILFTHRAQWGSGTHFFGKLWMMKTAVSSRGHYANSHQENMNKYKDTTSGSGSKWAAVCQRPGKDSGNVSLCACPVLTFISKHLLLLGCCSKQTLDSALSSITVMVIVKSPKCEERETTENWKRGVGAQIIECRAG